MDSLWLTLLLCCVTLLRSLDPAQAKPITITKWTLNHCQPGQSVGFPTTQCCPPKPINEPIVDFKPRLDPSKPLRVRKALQCLEGEELKTYVRKLNTAYALMKALPDSDPRSFRRQNAIHCAYGTGSFLQSPSSNLTIDIHWNWLFLPFHRLFVYFHERILQKLLNDEDFTLHFWNYDSGPGGDPVPHGCTCSKAGHFFPGIYDDERLQLFESNRSSRTREKDRIVDLTWDPRPYNLSQGPPYFPDFGREEQIELNREILHRTIITEGKNSSGFFGKELRVGVEATVVVGSSFFEMIPHSSMHTWSGGFGLLTFVPVAPLDPVFYPMHANVERLWSVWRGLHRRHTDPTDRDWLDASFLLWDENAVLRRVKVRDLVDTKALGYEYERVNDENWISFQP